ncbi:hypothetical protein BKA65DRAFT_595864 [Rhexocercosporidium sp. MPI-PUGE-AT-0058]|nr:hypothetical protein BKA65DRAFT_595864 [Rhexocercosporidium sp. MPI-PUGE-AT-0058]
MDGREDQLNHQAQAANDHGQAPNTVQEFGSNEYTGCQNNGFLSDTSSFLFDSVYPFNPQPELAGSLLQGPAYRPIGILPRQQAFYINQHVGTYGSDEAFGNHDTGHYNPSAILSPGPNTYNDFAYLDNTDYDEGHKQGYEKGYWRGLQTGLQKRVQNSYSDSPTPYNQFPSSVSGSTSSALHADIENSDMTSAMQYSGTAFQRNHVHSKRNTPEGQQQVLVTNDHFPSHSPPTNTGDDHFAPGLANFDSPATSSKSNGQSRENSTALLPGPAQHSQMIRPSTLKMKQLRRYDCIIQFQGRYYILGCPICGVAGYSTSGFGNHFRRSQDSRHQEIHKFGKGFEAVVEAHGSLIEDATEHSVALHEQSMFSPST